MNDFQVVKKTTVFKSEKVQVDRENIKLPNGNVAEWDVMVYPDFYEAATVKNNHVLLTKEWRQGPHDFLTQFTKARAPFNNEGDNLRELARELKEEMGAVDGNYEKLFRFAQGVRLTGFCTVYLITGFKLGKNSRDENEIQELIELPIKGLYQELLNHHVVMPETLLIAKLLEERFSSNQK